jgi:hypothetical protein
MKRITVVFVFAVAIFLSFRCAWAEQYSEEKGLILESLGAAYGTLIYDTQLIVVLTADVHGNNVYNKEEALNLLQEQKNFLNLQEEYIRKMLSKANPSASDVKSFNSILDSISGLRTFISSFENYANNPTSDNYNAYTRDKDASYGKIKAMLGI